MRKNLVNIKEYIKRLFKSFFTLKRGHGEKIKHDAKKYDIDVIFTKRKNF